MSATTSTSKRAGRILFSLILLAFVIGAMKPSTWHNPAAPVSSQAEKDVESVAGEIRARIAKLPSATPAQRDLQQELVDKVAARRDSYLQMGKPLPEALRLTLSDLDAGAL